MEEEMAARELWEVLKIFEAALEAHESELYSRYAVDDHGHITTEAKAAAILALLKA